jgi:hypothetical protein
MKVLALTAVNLNDKYLSCVPPFIDYWLSLEPSSSDLTYVPKVLVMADELPVQLKAYEEWCELFPLDANISTTFGSQMVRIFQPGLESADFVLTTDVDMLPLADRVFHVAVERLRKGAEFVICRDVLPLGQYPICYNIASPKVWRAITGVESQGQVGRLMTQLFDNLNVGAQYREEHGGAGWFSDQEELFLMISKFESGGGLVIKLKDRDTGHRRLDRLFMPFPINWLVTPAVALGLFSDYHVHHPVSRYKRYLDAVLFLTNKKDQGLPPRGA